MFKKCCIFVPSVIHLSVRVTGRVTDAGLTRLMASA